MDLVGFRVRSTTGGAVAGWLFTIVIEQGVIVADVVGCDGGDLSIVPSSLTNVVVITLLLKAGDIGGDGCVGRGDVCRRRYLTFCVCSVEP